MLTHVGDLTGFYPPNRIHKRGEQWTVEFHSVPFNVDDDDPEIQLLEIVLMLETPVCRYQNVAAALGLGNQLGIRECAPLCFG